MRIHWGAMLLLAGSCTPGPAPIKPLKAHPYFQIDGGSHALGNVTDAGEVMACTSCHALTVTNYSQFECVGCHEHSPQEKVDQRHAPYGGYVYASPACYRCHGQPIVVGGFTIAQPPAANGTTIQAGLDGLSHPTGSTGCISCHAQPDGGRGAFGYDHDLAPQTGCAACHEAGSTLVGSPWSLNAPGATPTAALCVRGGGTVADRGGDTRPVGITGLACSSGAATLTCGSQSCELNHFYPADCGECHLKPATIPATTQTGANFVTNWKFQHNFGPPAQPATCCGCHAPPGCSG